MRFERQSGLFCHPTSLPSPHGVGDLGAGARAFVDFLDRADQSVWAFCPLGPVSGAHGNSPYQSPSAFAGNPLLIDLRRLADRGYLTESEIEPPDGISAREVAYDRVRAFKRDRLRTAYERFDDAERVDDADENERAAFAAFVERESGWLDDYATFVACKDRFDGAIWTDWPEPIAAHEPSAVAEYREKLADEREFHQFVQWLFDRQWRELAEYAHDAGVQLVGDLPLYVARDSADVWAHAGAFALAEDGSPTAVAGVPPNPGDDGQRWGNPVYDWDALRETGYDWWIDRVERLFDLVDVARLDHFKGFDEFWAIPAEAAEPAAGEWRDGPGAALFEAIESRLGDLPFFVEDLGFLDEGIVSLRDRFDFPGTRVPQYADWCEEGNMYQPMHYPRSAVGYTATHDTDTIVGYYRSLDDGQRDCLHYNLGTDGDEIAWDVIEAVWNSEAVVAVTTPQDLLELDSEARFNTPGTATGNWRWRLPENALDAELADRLRRVTDRTIR